MIKVESVTIKEFRGIRDLTLNLINQNYAVCGPNGTGKSGVVDALEFALTGNISRLSGSGTGGLSTKEHGPHVDSRSNPDKASVKIVLWIPALEKKVTLERTVKDARNPVITPDDEELKRVLNQVLLHPEFTLSRREIIQYVISEPGKRSSEIQALLRLSDLEKLRSNFQKIANSEEKNIKQLERSKTQALADLATGIGLTSETITAETLLEAVNHNRNKLGLNLIMKLEAETSVKEGLLTTPETQTRSSVPKAIALSDIENFRQLLDKNSSKKYVLSFDAVKNQIEELEKDSDILEGITKQEFLQTALDVFDEQLCPVCDTAWEPHKFRVIVEEKLKAFEEIKQRRDEVEKALEPIIDYISKFSESLEKVAKYGPLLTSPIETKEIDSYTQQLKQGKQQLQSLTPLSDTLVKMSTLISVPKEVLTTVESLEEKILLIPEPSEQDIARDILVVTQERLDFYRKTAKDFQVAQEKAKTARAISDLYAEVVTTELESVYKDVEQKFADLYRIINHEDESSFEAKLIPSIGKLGFDVDFYGRGQFPPGAYHSEGHQDGMGLCLYLALMSHLLGEHFTFAVLDDVLMSVDAGHRREVCRLLQTEFPKTQFILTTHDDIWLRHMKTEGLIKAKSFAHFRKWTVDVGPVEWSDRDIWTEINEQLSINKVSEASALLRHYLEYMSHEICHNLRAKVEFRGDAHFVLGDLLPSAIGQMNKLLKEGAKSAESWNNTDKAEEVKKLKESFSEAVKVSQVEQWQINAAVHYNQWANFQKSDFVAVVNAFQNLLNQFHCGECESLLYVLPNRGPRELLRCSCSKITINLIAK